MYIKRKFKLSALVEEMSLTFEVKTVFCSVFISSHFIQVLMMFPVVSHLGTNKAIMIGVGCYAKRAPFNVVCDTDHFQAVK